MTERDWLLLGTGYVTVADIGAAVQAETGVTVNAIKGVRRDAATATARHMVMYLARELTAQSFPQIARTLGGKDHTCVMHGYRRMADRIPHDPALAALEMRCRQRAMAMAAGKTKGIEAKATAKPSAPFPLVVFTTIQVYSAIVV